MSLDDEINVCPEISEDFQNFAEFCSENTGREVSYLEVVGKNPLEMDSVTIAFSMRHLIRLSKDLLEMLLQSVQDDSMPPSLESILAAKGVQLDKTHAVTVRDVIFAYRDTLDEESRSVLVRAFQLMAITRERRRMILNLGESYAPPDEGWTQEDFGGDDSMLETVRAVEDPHWVTEEDM
jgi:hypothetical protein